MTKTQTIIALILAKDNIKRHEDFYKILSKLLTNNLFGLMGEDYKIEQVDKEKPHIKEVLNTLAYLLSYEQIQSRHAKDILESAWQTPIEDWDICHYIIDKKLFEEISIEGIIEEVIKEEAKAWSDYTSGKQQVIGRLIGCVMKKTKGKADPQEAKKLFEKLA